MPDDTFLLFLLLFACLIYGSFLFLFEVAVMSLGIQSDRCMVEPAASNLSAGRSVKLRICVPESKKYICIYVYVCE